MRGVSIIVCCYNSGSKLIPTLNHLAGQKIVRGVNYEVILVDNNCTDNTVSIGTETWALLNTPYPLKIIRQKESGLNYARQAGIQAASFEYLIFCDDDNWLCDDYGEKAYNLLEAMPGVGLIGGVGEAITEQPAPRWFNELNGFGYAVGAEGRQSGYVDSVYGAGMVLRKSLIDGSTNKIASFVLSDRLGENLSSGGDTEISMIFKRRGYEIYLETSLTFKHYIANNRLNWKYYLKLRKSFGQASAYLQLYNNNTLSETLLQKNDKIIQAVVLAKYALRNIKFLLFPLIYKSAACADFTQELSKRYTVLTHFKKIAMLKERALMNREAINN